MYSAFTLAKKYLQYYISASSGKGHGIHSPFVFNFIKYVLNDKKKYACYDEIESLRRRLLTNDTSIDVEDFGAGSSVIKTNKRVVSRIASSSLKPEKFAKLLFRIVQYYHPGIIIELGTSFGITSAYLASGNKNAAVYTFEGAPSIATLAQENFQQSGFKNIHLKQGDFQHTLPSFLSTLNRIDLAFIDGNHRKNPTLEYFKQFLKLSTTSTIIILDDIHWSREMEEAWEIIQQNDKVTLTVDLFFIGLVFVDPAFKVKQHFKIRF